MEIVYSSKVWGVGPDKVCWKLARSRGFKVSSFYLSFYPPSLSFPWRLVWHSKVPRGVAFFSWSASLGKILTTDNLRKWHIVVLDRCYMCKMCEESMDHLLLHCPLARELWSLVLCLFGLHWVMSLKVIELFEYWQGKFGRHHNIDFWRLVLHCLMWCIWRERNARYFEGCEWSLLENKSFFLHTLFVWSVALLHFFCFSLPFLLDHCNLGSWFLPPMYLGWPFCLLIKIFVIYQKKKEIIKH